MRQQCASESWQSSQLGFAWERWVEQVMFSALAADGGRPRPSRCIIY